ncbi:helix-turn-helix domain-containing protein [Companilactobacillus hulinensis]|uniref:helix-turn-helix domain-containing protein n=1 Tax=Companilactobacillus hulinensis TaxID=2486007 RepID=UPI000F797FD9|nr:helix-turn-helix transcriptional regulator [Companilactobacillus hulinensis]
MNAKDRIKALSNQRQITIAELERKLDFSNGTINKWNKQNPSSDKLTQVANYFNVSTDYLLGRTNVKNVADKKPEADLADDDVIMTFEGRPIPPEDIELMKRLLRGSRNDK